MSTPTHPQHKYTLELPDGDNREAKVFFSDRKEEDGRIVHNLCITVKSPEIEEIPTSLTEAITVNLVREGVNKHRARELAAHFYNLFTDQTAEPVAQVHPNHLNPTGYQNWCREVLLYSGNHDDGDLSNGINNRVKLYLKPPISHLSDKEILKVAEDHEEIPYGAGEKRIRFAREVLRLAREVPRERVD